MDNQEVVMTRDTKTQSKPRRLAALVAVLALASALSGCVVYPAGHYGGGYYHSHYWGHTGWR
jgi:ATP adenylyltransferase/5',5'''-P-1,P-4-tetraphosphate phosphorylase II